MGQTNDGYDIKLNFDISCETYQPVFDPLNERPADNTIKHLTFGLSTNKPHCSDDNYHKFTPVTDLSNKVVTTGQDVILEWRNFQDDTDMLYVDIMYRKEGDEDFQILDTVQNNNFYHWIVPEELNPDSINIDLIIPPAENTIVHTLPVLKLYPDPKSRIIDETNVLVLSKGLFFTQNERDIIPAIATYEDPESGEIIEHSLKINLYNGMVDEENPICMNPFVYNGKVPYTNIELGVRDHSIPEDFVSFCTSTEDSTNWLTIC